MTQLFGRVVQLQANANANLGQVAETLKSPLPLSPSERSKQELAEKLKGRDQESSMDRVDGPSQSDVGRRRGAAMDVETADARPTSEGGV